MTTNTVLINPWPSNIKVIVSDCKRHLYVVTSFSQMEGYEPESVIAITTCNVSNVLNDYQGCVDKPLS